MVKVKTKTTTEIEINLKDLKEILTDYVMKTLNDENVSVESVTDLTETEEIPMADPHDCDYVQRFSGIKITVKH